MNGQDPKFYIGLSFLPRGEALEKKRKRFFSFLIF